MTNHKVVLVTGASSGIGQAVARLFARKGYLVFGTSRNPSRIELTLNMEVLPLDVRSGDSVNACLEGVLNKSGRLDILINNAGYEFDGAVEEVSVEEAKAQFETNFFGVIRMVKAALPTMRRQRSGHIINISSLTGLVPVPFMGIYSASKFCVEGYTEVLRREVEPFNIRVSMVETGFTKTNLPGNRQYAANRIGDYDQLRLRVFQAINRYEKNAPSSAPVADCVLRIVESKSPELHYKVGREAKSVALLRRFLPEELFDMGMRDRFNLNTDKQK